MRGFKQGRNEEGLRTQLFVSFVSLVYAARIARISDVPEEADWELTIGALGEDVCIRG